MNVEDSYEGAVRRLRRLGHAGLEIVQPPLRVQQKSKTDQRMHDLEELATLACEENEQLKRELETARLEIDRLNQRVASLQELLAGDEQDDLFAAKSERGAGFYFFILLILGASAAALIKLRPWEPVPTMALVGLGTAPAAAPVVATPAPAPVVAAPAPVVAAPAPVVPAPAPTVPKVEPTAPKVEPAAPTLAPERKHASKHHSTSGSHQEHKRHGAAARSEKKADPSATSDPLGGLDL
jgi:hypothetical protein